MNTEGTGSHTYKECHKTESPWNHASTAHKEREQFGDRRSDGESSCNSGDGTGQMAQPWMFMMMMKWFVQQIFLNAKIWTMHGVGKSSIEDRESNDEVCCFAFSKPIIITNHTHHNTHLSTRGHKRNTAGRLRTHEQPNICLFNQPVVSSTTASQPVPKLVLPYSVI